MVLVSDKPSNGIGILQTKLRHREGHETRRVGLETMPLDQHVEGGHGERQARASLNIAPGGFDSASLAAHGMLDVVARRESIPEEGTTGSRARHAPHQQRSP